MPCIHAEYHACIQVNGVKGKNKFATNVAISPTPDAEFMT